MTLDLIPSPVTGLDLPALVASADERARRCFLEFSAATILPTAMNRRIAVRMLNAEAIEIEGAAHLVPVERPEQMNALMLERMTRWIEAKR